MKDRTFLYFPSLSVGEYSTKVQANWKIKDKLGLRFYNSEYGRHRYPYFLVSGGHHLKTPRSKWGFDSDVLVMGDSGGFQICSGAKKWDDKILEKTFLWLEENNDISINLDIPPRAAWEGKFNQSLDISMQNFEYFHTNQTGKTCFLNVLQGANHDEINKWYDSAKQFDKFGGWSLGGIGGKFYLLFEMLATLLKNKEHLKLNNKYLHILGTSSLDQFFIISCLQKALNDINSPMQVTTDSSSPGLAIVFGTCYMGMNQNTLSQLTIKLPQTSESGYMIPRVSAFDDVIASVTEASDFVKWNDITRNCTLLHNLYSLIDSIKLINSIVYAGEEISSQILKGSIYITLMKAINELVKTDNPDDVIDKYRPIFLSVDKMTYAPDKNHDFFNFE